MEEGNTTLITLDLSETPHRNIALRLALTPGSNLEAADYSVSPTEITFEATDTTKTITLTATGDFVDEDNEELRVTIVKLPTQVALGNTSHTGVTITGDGHRRRIPDQQHIQSPRGRHHRLLHKP